AAMSSSGLVPDSRVSARCFQVRARAGNAPLAGRTVPLPPARSPSHVASALLVTGMIRSFLSCVTDNDGQGSAASRAGRPRPGAAPSAGLARNLEGREALGDRHQLDGVDVDMT